MSGNESIVYIDPIIWTEPDPGVQCVPPCILVLPPSTLKSTTTFTFPPYVTSLEVGWITTIVVGGVTSTKFTAITTTTTLSIPPVTTTAVNFWNVNVTESSGFTFTPTTSILPGTFVITDTYPAGVTNVPATRTITPPPSPYSASSGAITAAPSTGQLVIIDGSSYYVGSGFQTITQNGVVETLGPNGISVSGIFVPYPTPGSTVTSGGITVAYPTPDGSNPYNSFETLTVDGTTIVVGVIGFDTITDLAGRTILVGSSEIIISSSTIPYPTQPTTTDGLTIFPPLPFFTTFPTQSVAPVTSFVPSPTKSSTNGKPEPVIPCTAVSHSRGLQLTKLTCL